MSTSRINPSNNAAASSNPPPQCFNNYAAVHEPAAASYRECRRNHAAAIGRYAFDGCGEFLKAGRDGTRAFLCAACGCHRSFHRKEVTHFQNGDRLRGEKTTMEIREMDKGKTKRTKITDEQRSKMRRFAEKLGWKPQKHDEEDVEKFCREVGISRKMFKVWLSNNRRRTVAEKCSAVIGEKNQAGVKESI